MLWVILIRFFPSFLKHWERSHAMSDVKNESNRTSSFWRAFLHDFKEASGYFEREERMKKKYVTLNRGQSARPLSGEVSTHESRVSALSRAKITLENKTAIKQTKCEPFHWQIRRRGSKSNCYASRHAKSAIWTSPFLFQQISCGGRVVRELSLISERSKFESKVWREDVYFATTCKLWSLSISRALTLRIKKELDMMASLQTSEYKSFIITSFSKREGIAKSTQLGTKANFIVRTSRYNVTNGNLIKK